MSVKSADELSEALKLFSEFSHGYQLGGNYPCAIRSKKLHTVAKKNEELSSSALKLASYIDNYAIISPNGILIPSAVL